MSGETGRAEVPESLPGSTYFLLVHQMLADSGEAFVRATGTSMMPLLHHLRDGVTIVPPDRIRLGDIVLFDRKNGRHALHRVVCLGRDTFSMAGDAQWHVETGLPRSQIVGVASIIHRDGKSIPASGFPMRAYAIAAACLTYPRVCLWRAVRPVVNLLRRRGRSPRA